MTYCPNRKFETVDAHNAELIQNWNSKISDNDIIIHLGDFAFGHPGKACSILSNLTGKKILIPGNHDSKNLKVSKFRSFWTYISTSMLELDLKDLYLVLCHFPIESWNYMHYGSIHLHGHCHSNRETGIRPRQIKNRLDMGVDYHNLSPVSLVEMLQEIDSHNRQLSIAVETS